MVYFDVYKYLVAKMKQGVSINYIVIFNEILENLSLSIVKITNIYESTHKNGVVIFITLNKL